MKQKNKGFTLVELLAVIVVLAIIALIGYSTIGNIITSAQQGADEATVREYVKGIETARYVHLSTTGTDIAKDKFIPQAWLTEKVKLNNSSVVCDIVKYEESVELLNCSVNDRTDKYCYSEAKNVYKCGSSESGSVEDKVVAIYGTAAGVGDKSKNLFDYSNPSEYRITGTAINKIENGFKYTSTTNTAYNSYVTYCLDFDEIKGKTITASGNFEMSANNQSSLRIGYWNDTQFKNLNSVTITENGNFTVKAVIPNVLPDDAVTAYCIFMNVAYNANMEGATLQATNLQVEEGSTATAYESYGYKIPITITKDDGTSTSKIIYIDKELGYGDYIDFTNSKIFVNGLLKDITIDSDLKNGNYKTIIFDTTNKPVVKTA